MNNSSGGIFTRMPSISLNRLVEWGDHFTVDQPQIDAQHEAIFNIAMEIEEAWKTPANLDRLKDLTAKLAKLLGIHFRYEERQLAEAGYPKLKEHAEEHRVMIEELRVIWARLHALPEGTHHLASGFIVHNFVLGLTVGHITHSDMDYCAFTRKPSADQLGARPAA
jgi:hemerythrin-like metal-binding protein